MNIMNYKGYTARIDYSHDDGCFVGHIAGINDIVGFHGDSVAELRGAFEEAVDDYFQTCESLNRLAATALFRQPYVTGSARSSRGNCNSC